MTTIAFISQKGGVGKSTLSRAFGREAAANGLSIKIADLDVQQTTTADWHRARMANSVEPPIAVEAFASAKSALMHANGHDVFILDGPARTSKATEEIARAADLIIQPTGSSLDDLRPAVREFNALAKAGVPRSKLVFALSRIGTNAEEADARDYLAQTGFYVLDGCLFEKAAYRQAQNAGRSITETPYKGLNAKAEALIQAIVDKVGE